MKAFVAVVVPNGVVTATFAAPLVPAGVTAVNVVGLSTVTPVAAFGPTCRVVGAKKPEPTTMIVVPPAIGPWLGPTDVTLGGATYMKAFGMLAVPAGTVTETVFSPAVPGGVRARMMVGDTTTVPVAATPPTCTVAGVTKPLPVIVMAVLPPTGPWLGLTEVIVGPTAYVKPFARLAVPLAVSTATVAEPAAPAGVVAVIVVVFNTFSVFAATPPY